MNKKLSKVLHTGIAAAMMLSMGNFEVFAEETDSKNNGGNETETTSGNTEKISINNDSNTEGKDETVYVITDASGEKQNVIVSDWLKNGSSSDIIKDYTTLKDIVNVKGDETYSTNNDGSISWNAEGNDIYYQGTTDAELPVAVKISYQLDGADISAEDLAGKSGHVTIRFDYENNSTKDVMINGKKTTIKTPFAMVSGLELPNDKFSNIQVENGKVISEGDNAFVIGMAFPGLKESLDLDDDEDLKDKIGDIEIPEYVQIEADVTDFSLEMNMTLASSSFLSDLKVDDDGTLDELKDDMNTLQSSAQELVDGTQTLKDGTGDLVDGAKKLDNGASDLKSGTSELYDGAGKLDDGAGTLKNGTSDLYTGTSKVDDGAGTLKNGTSDLYAGTSKVDDGAGSLASGATELSAGANALSTGAGTLADGTNALNSQVPALKEGVAQLQAGAESVATGTKQVDDALSKIINGIEVAQGQNPYSLKAGMQAADDGAKSLYVALEELQKQYVGATDTISPSENEYQNMLKMIATTYNHAVDAANQAEKAVIAAQNAMGKAKKQEQSTEASAKSALDTEDKTAAPAKRLKTLSLMEVAGVDPDEQDEAAAKKDAQISNVTSGNNALTSKNQVLESSNSDLQKENETLTSQNQTLTSQNQALKDQNTPLSDENQKLKDQNTQLSDENQKLKVQNTQLSDENQKLKAQIDSLKAQLDLDTANKQTADNSAPTESVQQSQPADTDNSADTALNQRQQDAAQAPNADDTNTNVNSLGENASETDGGADGQAVAQSYVSGGSVYSMSTDGSGLAPYPTDTFEPTSETGDAADAYNNAVAAYNAAVQNCKYLAGVYTTTAAKLASATNSTRAQLDALNSIFGAVLNGGKVTIVDAAKSTSGSIATKTYTPNGNMKSLSDSLDALNSGLTTVDESLNALHSSMKGSEKSPGLVAGAKQVASGLEILNASADTLAAGATQLNTGASSVKDGADKVAAGASQLNTGAASLKSGTSELKSGAKQLDDGASSLKSGTSELKAGAKKLDDGASDLKNGTADLKTGAKKLDDGASDLKNGTSDLADGAVKLDDGAQELLEGMTKFKEEGIDQLADLFGDHLTDVIDRLKEVCDAGAEYSSFAGNEDNGTNTVKFIFKTDAIKSASDSAD